MKNKCKFFCMILMTLLIANSSLLHNFSCVNDNPAYAATKKVAKKKTAKKYTVKLYYAKVKKNTKLYLLTVKKVSNNGKKKSTIMAKKVVTLKKGQKIYVAHHLVYGLWIVGTNKYINSSSKTYAVLTKGSSWFKVIKTTNYKV